MSHFTRVKTQILEKETLIEVLKELGYHVSFSPTLLGYRDRNTQVDFQVEACSGHYLGFKKVGNSYDIIADLWGIPHGREKISRIKQNYAKKIVVRNIKRQGYNLIEEKNENGNIKMVVVRR